MAPISVEAAPNVSAILRPIPSSGGDSPQGSLLITRHYDPVCSQSSRLRNPRLVLELKTIFSLVPVRSILMLCHTACVTFMIGVISQRLEFKFLKFKNYKGLRMSRRFIESTVIRTCLFRTASSWGFRYFFRETSRIRPIAPPELVAFRFWAKAILRENQSLWVHSDSGRRGKKKIVQLQLESNMLLGINQRHLFGFRRPKNLYWEQ